MENGLLQPTTGGKHQHNSKSRLYVGAECSPLFCVTILHFSTAMNRIIVSYYVILKVLGVYNQKRVLLCS